MNIFIILEKLFQMQEYLIYYVNYLRNSYTILIKYMETKLNCRDS
jgi:hypothetical protein